MGDRLAVHEVLTLAVPAGIRPTGVGEELEAMVAGRYVEIDIDGEGSAGLRDAGDDRVVQEIVGPGVGVAGVVGGDPVIVQVDTEPGVVEH